MAPFRPSTIVLPIDGPLARADVPGLCERVCALVAGSSAAILVCELGSSVRPDAVAVETLARVQLTVRRLGRRVQLRHASRELQELLAFLGLEEVIEA